MFKELGIVRKALFCIIGVGGGWGGAGGGGTVPPQKNWKPKIRAKCGKNSGKIRAKIRAKSGEKNLQK